MDIPEHFKPVIEKSGIWRTIIDQFRSNKNHSKKQQDKYLSSIWLYGSGKNLLEIEPIIRTITK